MQVYNTLNFTLSRLLSAYESLLPSEQTVLQMLAVVYKPIAQTKFNQILKLVDGAFLYPDFELAKTFSSEFKSKASELGLLNVDKHGIQISRTLSTELTLITVACEHYYDLLTLCEQISPVTPE